MLFSFPAMDRFLEHNIITDILYKFNVTEIHQIQDILMLFSFPAMDRFLEHNNITEILYKFNVTEIHQIQDIL